MALAIGIITFKAIDIILANKYNMKYLIEGIFGVIKLVIILFFILMILEKLVW